MLLLRWTGLYAAVARSSKRFVNNNDGVSSIIRGNLINNWEPGALSNTGLEYFTNTPPLLTPPAPPSATAGSPDTQLLQSQAVFFPKKCHSPLICNQLVTLASSAYKLRPSQYEPTVVAVTRTFYRQYRPPAKRHPRRGDLPVDRHALSLLEELFPAETRKTSGNATSSVTRKPREIPNQPLDQLLSPELEEEVEEREGQRRKEEEEREQRRALAETAEKEKYIKSAVLVLRNAGKNLVEEDFRRIVPGSKHIEGWGESSLLKVIRSRDLRTLEPDGNYILIFRTAEDAKSYERYAKQLHTLSQAHLPVPGDLTPPLPPPPIALDPSSATQGYAPPYDGTPLGKSAARRAKRAQHLSPSLGDTSLYGALQSYALLPPTNRLDLRVAQQPHSPLLQTILRHGNYEVLMRDRHPLAAAEVLLSVAWGWSPKVDDIRRAIARDGKVRGLTWRVVRSEGLPQAEHGIRRVNKAVREIRVGLDGKPMATSRDATAGVAESEGNGRDGDSSEGDLRMAEAESAEQMESGERQRSKMEKWRRRHRKKWIVSFKEEDEARRFVTSWHRRDVTELLGEMVPVDENVIMNADLI
ncbi:MAG: hypothetical protein M1831_000474 [Alyxoria varia]|nr:MAG: hypothetical protein M1831_000474 [Alyxoria varia]